MGLGCDIDGSLAAKRLSSAERLGAAVDHSVEQLGCAVERPWARPLTRLLPGDCGVEFLFEASEASEAREAREVRSRGERRGSIEMAREGRVTMSARRAVSSPKAAESIGRSGSGASASAWATITRVA